MFQLADTSKPVKWPVKFKFPTNDGEQEAQFFAFFFFKTEEEIKKLTEQLDDVIFLQKTIQGFEELQDSKGKLIKGTANDIKKICSVPRIKMALIDAYYEFNNGDLKNYLRR